MLLEQPFSKKHTATASELYMAFELGEKSWKLSQNGASVRVEGQRARSGSGLPAGDRPQRWGALVNRGLDPAFRAHAVCGDRPGVGTDRSSPEQRIRSSIQT